MIDAPADRQLIESLQSNAVSVRPLSDELLQFVQKQQSNDVLKLAMDKRLPACKDLERSARDFPASQRAKMNSETNDVLATAAETRILAFIFFGLTVVCSLVIEQLGRMGSQVTDRRRAGGGAGSVRTGRIARADFRFRRAGEFDGAAKRKKLARGRRHTNDSNGLLQDARLDEVTVAMRQLTGSAIHVQRLSNEVNAGSEEQARAIQQISRAILQIQKVTQQTTASAEDCASAGAQMSSEADLLAISRTPHASDGRHAGSNTRGRASITGSARVVLDSTQIRVLIVS